MQDMYFDIELPSPVVEATIPVTAGCSKSFNLFQQATGAAGEPYPVEFGVGDAVYISIKTRGQTVQVDATPMAQGFQTFQSVTSILGLLISEDP